MLWEIQCTFLSVQIIRLSFFILNFLIFFSTNFIPIFFFFFFFRIAYYPGGHPFFLVMAGSELLSVSCFKCDHAESSDRAAGGMTLILLCTAAFWGRAGGGIRQCLGDRLRNQMILCKANLQCACSLKKQAPWQIICKNPTSQQDLVPPLCSPLKGTIVSRFQGGLIDFHVAMEPACFSSRMILACNLRSFFSKLTQVIWEWFWLN